MVVEIREGAEEDGLIPRDALQGHRRGKNPVAYVFIFIFLPRSRKRQCLILIEV